MRRLWTKSAIAQRRHTMVRQTVLPLGCSLHGTAAPPLKYTSGILHTNYRATIGLHNILMENVSTTIIIISQKCFHVYSYCTGWIITERRLTIRRTTLPCGRMRQLQAGEMRRRNQLNNAREEGGVRVRELVTTTNSYRSRCYIASVIISITARLPSWSFIWSSLALFLTQWKCSCLKCVATPRENSILRLRR